MNILGISAFYHDAACALLQDGVLTAAGQEERFSRVKHDPNFPILAIEYTLAKRNLGINDIDSIVFYEKPILKFDRILIRHFVSWPFSLKSFWSMQNVWLSKKFRIQKIIREQLKYSGQILFCRHHESHAAAAFFSSPFRDAVIVSVDGVGEWCTTGIHRGSGSRIESIEEIQYPHSLGLFYSAFTDYLGFQINDGEYKVMGMAPNGQAEYADLIEDNILKLNTDGSFQLNLNYFAFETSDYMLNFDKVEALLKIPRRVKGDPLELKHFNLAASVQLVLERALINLTRAAVKKTGLRNVCLGGGVALNCRANSLLKALPEVDNLYVFPVAGDAGAAVGAASFIYHQIFENERRELFPTPYLGPDYSNEEIEIYLKRLGVHFEYFEDSKLCSYVAQLLFEQKIIGWFQGAMEFGPRALGNRSILADPRKKENWSRVNEMIKFREDFRPLAPAVTVEDKDKYFDFNGESPYMIFTAQNKTKELPAVTHADGSSRIQTVAREQNSKFHELLTEFEKLSGVPVLINTSFNTSGMPIVCTPQNAFQAFAESKLDYLVLGNFILDRAKISFLSR